MKFKGLLVAVAIGSVALGEGIIKEGDPESQVVATRGEPQIKMSEGGTTYYKYAAGTIVVKNGKVVDLPDESGAAGQLKKAEGKLYNLSSLPSLPEGGEALLMKVPAYRYNNVSKGLNKKVISVTFDGVEFSVYNDTDIFGEMDCFLLSSAAVLQLVNMMEKYQEWNTKALALGTTVQKEIGSLSVVVVWMNRDREWHFGSRPVTATCAFFSQNEKQHQMVVQFEKVSSKKNKYTNHCLETIYLDSEGVTSLLEAFSRPNIDTKVAEHKRKKQVESQFQ